MSTYKSINRLLAASLPMILYLLLSLIHFGVTRHLSRRCFGTLVDPIAYIWFFNWWPWAIAHGLNPFVWYPHGFNLTWAGSIPSAALLMWPVFVQETRKDSRVVIDDHICNQATALIADLDVDIGFAGQLFLASHLSNCRSKLVVGLDAIL